MKKCYKCEKLLDESLFFKDARQIDGLGPSCKKCKSSCADKRLQAARDKRRYAKLKAKTYARTITRKIYGKASDKVCFVSNCSEIAKEWHHIDYEDPLAVIALCNKHHRCAHS